MKTIRYLSAVGLILLGLGGRSSSHAAPLLLNLKIYCGGSAVRADQHYYAFPVLSTTNPPLTYHQVYSPQTNLQSGLGPGSITSSRVYASLGDLLAEFTAGPWTLILNAGAPAQATYSFTVSPQNMPSNLFPNIQITSPTNGLVGAGRKPAYTWIGPANWQGLTVEAYDDNFIVDVAANLSPNARSWSGGPTLVGGVNYFDVTYNTNATPYVTISVPLDLSSHSPPGWASSATLCLTDESEFQVGNPNANFTNTLVAHYSFDNPTSLGHDDSSRGNNVVSSGSLGGGLPAYTPAGVAGGAVQFNGSNWFLLPTNLIAVVARDFSVSLWLRTTQASGSDTAQGFATAGILTAELAGVPNDVIPMALTGQKLALFTGNPDTTLHSDSAINSGAFMHLAVTRRQTDGGRNVYINGQLDASDYGSVAVLNAATNFFLGFNGANSLGIQGIVDDVQLYSGVLNDSEVAYLATHAGSTVAGMSPLSVFVFGPTTVGTDFPLSFFSTVGHTYTVQSSTNLAQNTWVDLFTVAGDGTLKQVGIPTAGFARRYFRVRTN
jgi:hypothetical protein